MYDMVIRNGLVYDGTGTHPQQADVAITGNTIAAVGRIPDAGREEIDAAGHIVTPGFVDAHTHYDGQVTWDPYITPSTFHGVTTVITGNCGVGFAPCRPDQRDWLIGLMEGVEDIPGTALHEGIDWRWESFPEYLDTLEQTPLAIDVGTQVPHGAVRAYVMGERGPAHETASPEEILRMGELVAEAIEAGALGFSTSRTEKHRDSSGVLTPTITAHEDELVTINQLVDIVEGIAGVRLERHYRLDAPQGVRGRNSDNTRIRERLGWDERPRALAVGRVDSVKGADLAIEMSGAEPRFQGAPALLEGLDGKIQLVRNRMGPHRCAVTVRWRSNTPSMRSR